MKPVRLLQVATPALDAEIARLRDLGVSELRSRWHTVFGKQAQGSLVGGMAPLGYDTKDRRIMVNEPEAETVRTIFRSYLKLGSLNLLMADLRKRGIVTKVRTLKTGETVGGIPFTRGS